MNFSLLSLSTLLMLGVTSVCAGNQPNRYSAKVQQGTLFYYHNAPNGPGQWTDRICFQPDSVKWYRSGWRIIFENANQSGDRIPVIGQGNSCSNADRSNDVYQYIAKKRGFNHVYFQFEAQDLQYQLRWSPA